MLETAKKVIRNSESLPSAPTLIAELSNILKDDDATAGDFEKIVRQDTRLTENLLRLANAAYFGVRRDISTIRQAIAFLGSDRVFELATSAWLCSALPYRIPGYDISAKSLWLHSVATGVLCERLASALRIKPPDLVFTAGLLHDIGKLVVGELLVGQSERILQEINNNGTTFFKAEQTLLDTDHAEIGALLCEIWELPPALAWTARWHHSPNEAAEHTSERLDLTLVDLVHLSDGLAHTLGFGADIGDLSRTIENETMDRLLVDKQSIDQTVSETVVNCIWEMGDLVAGGISC